MPSSGMRPSQAGSSFAELPSRFLSGALDAALERVEASLLAWRDRSSSELA